MELIKLGLYIVTYFLAGVLIARITLGVQTQLKEQNNDDPIDTDTKLGIAGLITPLWPLFLVILLGYFCLALIMNIFSRLVRPFI